MLGYVLPILTEAWPGKGRGGGLLPPLNSKFAGASHTNPHEGTAREGGKVQNDLQCQGLLPPFLGGATHSLSEVRFCLTMFHRGLLPPILGGAQICTPFLNFGPGGIAPGRAIPGPLLLTDFVSHFANLL